MAREATVARYCPERPVAVPVTSDASRIVASIDCTTVPGVPPPEEVLGRTPPPGVSPAHIRGWRFTDFLGVRWKLPEHIIAGELRAMLLWLEVLARELASRGKRLPLLSDSLVTVGSWTKGRSPSFLLNRLLRRRAALELAGVF